MNNYKYLCINGWNKQSMIEHVKEHFKGKSYIKDDSCLGESCLYRAEDGRKCAVGMFVPASLYSPSFEKASAYSILNNNQSLANCMPITITGMALFQVAHDNLDNCLTSDQQRDKLLSWIEENVE